MKTLDHIAAELQGYDPQALSADDVLLFLSKLVMPVEQTLALPLFEAFGRVLAEDVVSPFDVPPHDNSAMDGYAFDGKDLATPTVLALQVVGTAFAGKAWHGSVKPGECIKIMTGAIMPAGLDTVVPQEMVVRTGDVVTFAPSLLQAGDNRRLRGEDLAQGRCAMQKGELLTPARLGLAASLGLETLRCYRSLRVAYFSTGDEILSLGEPPREGAVYDSNRYTVFGLLKRMGCEVIDMGVVRDEPALLQSAFTQAARKADAVITSGGVSVGEADHTKAMMKKLGDVAFWRIAMRPGRPMAVGRITATDPVADPAAEVPNLAHLPMKSTAGPSNTVIHSYENSSSSGNAQPSTHSRITTESAATQPNGAIVFGLPGNPVAVMVTFLAFVRPALLQMMGATTSPPPLLKAHSQELIRKKPGRTEYQRGWVSTAVDGSLQVKTTGNQGSGVLSSMAQANGLIVLHHAQGNVVVGQAIDVLMFDGVI